MQIQSRSDNADPVMEQQLLYKCLPSGPSTQLSTMTKQAASNIATACEESTQGHNPTPCEESTQVHGPYAVCQPDLPHKCPSAPSARPPAQSSMFAMSADGAVAQLVFDGEQVAD